MAKKMLMPKVEKEQETGTILEWLRTEGQGVKKGEIILVIETEKIAIDVESPGTGILAGISAQPGDVVPVGAVIAYILAEGEELPEGAPQPRAIVDSAPEEDLLAKAGIKDSRAGEQIPLSGMRKIIAERLNASYRTIPHIQFSGGVDMTNFNKARRDYNDVSTKGDDRKVTVTTMLVKLVAVTLAAHPLLNSSLQDEVILLHEQINIGLAVALENGLIVPVIKNADQKTISQIAAESEDLVTRAREGSLTSADIRGATFTISNLGPYGVEQFNAIINPPEVCVLAFGAIQPKALPLEGGEIAVRPYMRFTLSADHRVVDGAVAAGFIADLKTILEDPGQI